VAKKAFTPRPLPARQADRCTKTGKPHNKQRAFENGDRGTFVILQCQDCPAKDVIDFMGLKAEETKL
jgi:hypothetical protein